MEIALKVRELTATVAEGFSSADLMHGPIAAIAPATPAIMVAARGKALGSVLETAEALEQRGAEPILIGERPDANLVLPSGVPEWLSPIIAVVPGQVLAPRRAVVGGTRSTSPPA
jgi:glucosamine--fructose-6-phosphate aminotransferase (isomerizing)